MSKKKKTKDNKNKTVRSINNNVRSSVRKLNQYLETLLEKRLRWQLEIYNFQKKNH